MMVTQKSATSIGLVASANEDNIPLESDHRDLVKYRSRRDPRYTVVQERIGRLVREAKGEVERRFASYCT